MPCLDTRYLSSSSLTPTSTVYYKTIIVKRIRFRLKLYELVIFILYIPSKINN